MITSLLLGGRGLRWFWFVGAGAGVLVASVFGCARGLAGSDLGEGGGDSSGAGAASGASTNAAGSTTSSGSSSNAGSSTSSSGAGGASSSASSSAVGSSSAVASSSGASSSSAVGSSSGANTGAGGTGGGPTGTCSQVFDYDFADCTLGPWTTGLAHPSSAASSWQCGDPMNVGPAGTGMWGTNLSGNYRNNESSYLMSPVFSLATCTGVIQLHVTHWFRFYDGASCTPFCDGGIFQISTNGGTTFNSMDAIQNGYTTGFWNIGSTYQPPDGEKGFHNRSGGVAPPIWLTSVWNLSSFVGQPNMRFRFVIGSGGSLNSATAPGWYIDQVKIVVQ